MLKPYLVSNREEKMQPMQFDYKKKTQELKGILNKLKEKPEKKVITLKCKKNYCTIKDNRCCGVQMFDEG